MTVTPNPANAESGDTCEIADLLASLERTHHAAGWDMLPPTLYIVMRRHDQLTVLPLGLDYEHPRPALVGMAYAATSPQRWPELAPLYQSPPVAHLYLTETSLDTSGADSYSYEARVGLAVTNTLDLVVVRRRDTNTVTTLDNAERLTDQVSRRALRQLHTGAVCSHLQHLTGSSTS